MLGKIAAFEFRYQLTSPLFAVAAVVLFAGTFFDMAVRKTLVIGGGQVLYNAPHAIIVSHLGVSLLFLFVGAAFVSNVIVRDDQTGFGPILRSTDIRKSDYLFGRFLGAFAIAALLVASATLGQWIGTLMPFANEAMIGPNRMSGFLYGYGLFALPNAFIFSAVLFALATATRSTAGTFLGVFGLFCLYFVSQGLMQGQPRLLDFRVLADPLGMTAYMASSRYFTAAELNAGAIPVTNLMLVGRLLWVMFAVALLALTYDRFRFEERGPLRRQQRKLRKQAVLASVPTGVAAFAPLPQPRFGHRTGVAQFVSRAAMEARFIFRSPVFLIMLVMASVFTMPGLLGAASMFGTPLYPLTFVAVPIIEGSFTTILVIIATYYGGELVWRERERKVHEILDATPIPAWASMLPKMLGLALVLFATLLVAVAMGLLVQVLQGVDPAPAEFLRWYLLPVGVDVLLLAVLAVFVQALSPSKYAGWGVMVVYLLLLFVGPTLGLEHPLTVYGRTPEVPLGDMVGTGLFAAAAWWFRLFWAALAVVLLVAAHLLWPRGTDTGWQTRLRRLRLSGPTAWVAVAAAALFVSTGAWIVYNTSVLNDFRTSANGERYAAEYEKRFFHYARLPQPTVKHVELDVALFPEDTRAEVRGRYRLVNETAAPIDRVHVRLANRNLELLALDFPAARLEHDDPEFGYRIYRLDVPMQPGEARSLAFRTLRQQRGFRASGPEKSLAPNGTDLDSLELAPRIGMTDAGLLTDAAARRKYGLPEERPFPRLDDLTATRILPNADLSWTTSDITVSTTADQIPVAPGKQVSERVRDGRRTVRFVSDAPIKNFFSIQSARYAVRKAARDGVELAVYFHPAHHWNVDRMLSAMEASIAYFSDAFGPYQFDQARIVETPAYRDGAQAFPNTLIVGETAGFAMDLRDPETLDLASVITAHEISHQWWGHQVVPARMQGAGMLVETLAQYSALMVMKQLHGEEKIRRLLQFQLDRYLSGRRTQVLAEEPLVRVEPGQQHLAYGKGALAMYQLQERMGEDAVNRALKRFLERYRYTTAPYPRSVDLVALLREEATLEDQPLITDLFERITLYDLKVETPQAVQRVDGMWEVTVPVEATKFYADGTGKEQEAPLHDAIGIGLFTAEPGSRDFERSDVIRVERQTVRSGRQVFRFVTRAKPTHAGVDPYNFYIDRNPRDNVQPVE